LVVVVVVESDIPKCDDVHVKKLSKLPSSCSIFFLTLNLVLRYVVHLFNCKNFYLSRRRRRRKTVTSIFLFLLINWVKYVFKLYFYNDEF
jgi:hypothetical protein